ncbi:MAG: rhodanese-like domain-containing protein [Chloroflexi bacterium]|nr:MAG: rhodanese-like domain-containing protein [Chloroflexota bacterium]
MFQSLFGYRQSPIKTQQRVQTNVKQIRSPQLFAQLQNGNAPLLVDVRSPEEYQTDGHIEGSRLLPLPMLLQRMDELPKDKPIVCVCRSGNRSQVACEQLAAFGFTDLTNLAGGMIDWRRNGLPSK